jgi:hypothetical protein
MRALLSRRLAITVLIWVVALGGTAFLAQAYLAKLTQVAPIVLQHPRSYLLEVLTSPRAAPPVAAPGDVVLEAETAVSKSRDWEVLKDDSLSGGAAALTRKNGSALSFAVDLRPGSYTVYLRTSAAVSQARNEISVEVGGQSCAFRWRGARMGSSRVLTQPLVLDRPAREVRVRADHVRQGIFLLDCLVIRPGLEMPGDGWLRFLCILGAVGGLLLAAGCWGAFLWPRLIAEERSDPLVRLVLQQALGLGLVATATTLLGILGWFRLPIVAGLLVVGLLAGGRLLVRALNEWLTAEPIGLRLRWALLGLPLALGLAALVATALCPASGIDQQLYHLPVAKWLIGEGGYEYHPHQTAWAYPHNISNLFAVAQLLDSDEFFRTAQVTHACLGLVWLVSVYALGKVLFGRATALAAVALCAAIDLVPWEFGNAVVDLGFAAFAGAALLAFVQAIQNEPAGGARRWLILAALLSGAAAACKVNGPSLAVALALATALWQGRQAGWRSGLCWFCLIGVLAFVVAMPMYVKNWLLYYNPIYPFTTLFPNRDMTPDMVNAWFTDQRKEDFRLMFHGVRPFWQWPYAWMLGEFMEPTSPGPGVLAALLLMPALGWRWLKRHWPLLTALAALTVLWVAIAPLTRFAYVWVGALLVLACAPFSLRRLRWPGILIPVALLICAAPKMALQVEGLMPQFTHLAQHQSNDRYLRWMEPGTRSLPANLFSDLKLLSREYQERPWGGLVLLDAVHLAYVDFPSVPSPSYLWARSQGWDQFVKLDLQTPMPGLAGYATQMSDMDLLREWAERLGASRILVHKGASPHLTGAAPAKRLDQVLDRWARQGLVQRRELSESVLYTFDFARVPAMLRLDARSRSPQMPRAGT